MSATRTRTSLVRDALRFFSEPEIFMVIGRVTPWQDEAIPPAADMNATTIEEIVAYKKVTDKQLVIPTTDTTGNIITWRGGNYKIVPTENAMTEGAHWVYIKAEIAFEELPATTFRQIGVCTGLVRKGGVDPNKTILSPSDVQSIGYLELIENRKPISHNIDTTEIIQYIREF